MDHAGRDSDLFMMRRCVAVSNSAAAGVPASITGSVVRAGEQSRPNARSESPAAPRSDPLWAASRQRSDWESLHRVADRLAMHRLLEDVFRSHRVTPEA